MRVKTAMLDNGYATAILEFILLQMSPSFFLFACILFFIDSFSTNHSPFNVMREYVSLIQMLGVHHGRAKAVFALINAGASSMVKDSVGKTALHWAIESGNQAMVSVVLTDPEADIVAKDNEGSTPLHAAVALGSADDVITLLEARPNANLTVIDSTGRTALHWAAASGHHEIVTALISLATAGFKARRLLDLPDTFGGTALHYAAQLMHVSCVRTLAQAGASSIPDRDGNHPLHWAVMGSRDGSHSAAVIALSTAKGFAPNAANAEGRTAMHLVAMVGDSGLAATILDTFSVDLNARDAEGKTPLLTACETGATDIVLELIAHGAALNLVDHVEGRTGLVWSCVNNLTDTAIAMVDASADVNTVDSSCKSPLMYAAFQGATPIVGLLVEHSANPNLQDVDGVTALHWASLAGHADAVRALLAAGAEPNATESAESHATPLDYATLNGHDNVADILRSAGGMSSAELELMMSEAVTLNAESPTREDTKDSNSVTAVIAGVETISPTEIAVKSSAEAPLVADASVPDAVMAAPVVQDDLESRDTATTYEGPIAMGSVAAERARKDDVDAGELAKEDAEAEMSKKIEETAQSSQRPHAEQRDAQNVLQGQQERQVTEKNNEPSSTEMPSQPHLAAIVHARDAVVHESSRGADGETVEQGIEDVDSVESRRVTVATLDEVLPSGILLHADAGREAVRKTHTIPDAATHDTNEDDDEGDDVVHPHQIATEATPTATVHLPTVTLQLPTHFIPGSDDIQSSMSTKQGAAPTDDTHFPSTESSRVEEYRTARFGPSAVVTHDDSHARTRDDEPLTDARARLVKLQLTERADRDRALMQALRHQLHNGDDETTAHEQQQRRARALTEYVIHHSYN